MYMFQLIELSATYWSLIILLSLSSPMADPNFQFPAASGSRNPNFPMISALTLETEKSSSEERERLARICDAYDEEYDKEETIRFKKYGAEMRRDLLEKYFSDKDIYGDKIFEESSIDGVKASRWPGTESYVDPVAYLKKKKEAVAKSAANTSTEARQTTNGFTDILKKNLP